MKGLRGFHDSLNKSDRSLEIQQDTFRNIVTGQIYMAMESESVSKKDLAGRLGVSKPAVTSMLSGYRNLTIDKISEISFHLNHTPQFSLISNRDMYKEQLKTLWVYIEKSESHMQIYDVSGKKKVDYHKKRARMFASFVDSNHSKMVAKSYVTEEL